MGFNSVYQLLRDQFPTIDARVLKAVALEHSSDANQAFCVVLDEIIPLEPQKNVRDIPVRAPVPPPPFPVRTSIPPPPPAFPMRSLLASPPPPPASIAKKTPTPPAQTNWSWNSYGSSGKGSTFAYPSGYPNYQYPPVNTPIGGSSSVAGTSRAPNHFGSNSGKNKTMFPSDNLYKPVTPSSFLKDIRSNQKSKTESGFHQSSTGTSKSPSNTLFGFLPGEVSPMRPSNMLKTREVPIMEVSKVNLSASASGTSSQLNQNSRAESGFNLNGMGTSKSSSNSSFGFFPGEVSFQGPPAHMSKTRNVPVVDMPKVNESASSKVKSRVSSLSAAPVMKTSDSKTDQPLSKLLGELIEDVEKDKTNVISAMESVVNIMKEVEAKKQEALWAKAEAAGGGADILAKVEIIQKQLQKLVASNGKLAGEVKETQLTLTNEASEIQSSLLQLFEEKDKSVNVLDDMRRALEAQLAAAEQELEKANLMKRQKEENARKVQAEELALKKMTEEAEILELAAQENSKIQELLNNYRRKVELLEWDMDDIRHYVNSLKEKVDQRIPFSETSFALDSLILSQKSEFSCQSYSLPGVPSLEPSQKKAALDSAIISQESEASSQLESDERSPPQKKPDLDSTGSSQEGKESTESASYERTASLVASPKRSAMDSSFSSQGSEDSADSESSDILVKCVLNRSASVHNSEDSDNEDSAEFGPFEHVAPLASSPLTRASSYSSFSSDESEDFTQPESAEDLASKEIILPSPSLSASVMSPQTVVTSEQAEPSDLVSVSSVLSQKGGNSEQAEPSDLVSVSSVLSRKSGNSEQSEDDEVQSFKSEDEEVQSFKSEDEEVQSVSRVVVLTDGKAPSNNNIVEDGWDLCDGSDSDF